jgi:tRNA pseudouridine55 synthase
MIKQELKPIHGIILLDKGLEISSNKAMQQVRFLFRAQKSGHTGILDPMASGLLPICLGEATKFSQYLLDANKGYLTTMQFGQTSSTGDVEGTLSEHQPSYFTLYELRQVLASFTQTTYLQVPPMYSALKHKGKPLYEYARQGIEIKRTPRQVQILNLELLHFDSSLMQATLKIFCSKGTYIRSLVEDIAKALNSAAYVLSLRRIATGGFQIEQAKTFDKLQGLPDEILPIDTLIQHLPSVQIQTEKDTLYFLNGRTIQSECFCGTLDRCRVYGIGQRFLGIGQLINDVLKPVRLLSHQAAWEVP